jgi:hypothetical protein
MFPFGCTRAVHGAGPVAPSMDFGAICLVLAHAGLHEFAAVD